MSLAYFLPLLDVNYQQKTHYFALCSFVLICYLHNEMICLEQVFPSP